MKHNILILLLVIFLSACSDATVRIVEYPRFVHEGTDPVPTKRNNTYPATFDADMAAADASCVGIGKRIAGFDHEMQYIKEEGPFADKLPDDDERFVQYLETVTEQDPRCRPIALFPENRGRYRDIFHGSQKPDFRYIKSQCHATLRHFL